MLESPMNAATLGEVVVEEADDGTTALQALKTATLPCRIEANSDYYSLHNERDRGTPFIVQSVRDTTLLTGTEEGNDNPMQTGPKVGFDLVLIDYVMTTMDGPEAVQIMRRDLKFTGGIIGVTGNALPADLTYFKDCGADLVITKPLTNKKLMDAIQSLTHTNKKNGSNILTREI